MARGIAGWYERWFFWLAGILILAVVVLGFSRTIGENLLHPDIPRPAILAVHAVLTIAWILLFLAQASLVRTRQIRWHRRLGAVGAVLGTALPVVGVATALVMARWRTAHGSTSNHAFLAVPLTDMIQFAALFGTAIALRTQPDLHRRLMFLATCILTVAAFGRFPQGWWPDNGYYLGVDLIIALAIARDLIARGRPNIVYVVAVPLILIVQGCALYAALKAPPWWLNLVHALLA